MYVSEQDMLEVLYKLQARENTMKDNPKEKVTMPISMQAYSADAGVWVALMGAIDALRKVRTIVDQMIVNSNDPFAYTNLNAAKHQADQVLAQFKDPEDLGA